MKIYSFKLEFLNFSSGFVGMADEYKYKTSVRPVVDTWMNAHDVALKWANQECRKDERSKLLTITTSKGKYKLMVAV